MEALLNTIIKRNKKTDKKINILAHMLAHNGSQMPPKVFSDDEEEYFG